MTINSNQKWHVNHEGIVGKCTATTRACPYTAHFSNVVEAQQYADYLNEQKYQMLPFMTATNQGGVNSPGGQSVTHQSPSITYSTNLKAQSTSASYQPTSAQLTHFNDNVIKNLDKYEKIATTNRQLIDLELTLLEKHRMNRKSVKETLSEQTDTLLDKMGAFGDSVRSVKSSIPNPFSSLMSMLPGKKALDGIVNLSDSQPLYGHKPDKHEQEARDLQMKAISMHLTGRTMPLDNHISAQSEMSNIKDNILSSINIDISHIPQGVERSEAQKLIDEHIDNVIKTSLIKPDGRLYEKDSNFNKLINRLHEANQIGESRLKGKQLRDECNYILHSIGFCDYPYLLNSKGQPKSYYEKDQSIFLIDKFRDNYIKLNSDDYCLYETDSEFNSRIKESGDKLKSFMKKYTHKI